MRRDDAEHLIAHLIELVVIGEIAGTDHLDVRLVEAAFGELFGEDSRLRAGKVDERRIGREIADTLQERRKVGVGERDAHLLDDLAAAWLKLAMNAVSASMPGAHSFTSVTTRLLPVFAAHWPMIEDDCPSVKLVRT